GEGRRRAQNRDARVVGLDPAQGEVDAGRVDGISEAREVVGMDAVVVVDVTDEGRAGGAEADRFLMVAAVVLADAAVAVVARRRVEGAPRRIVGRGDAGLELGRRAVAPPQPLEALLALRKEVAVDLLQPDQALGLERRHRRGDDRDAGRVHAATRSSQAASWSRKPASMCRERSQYCSGRDSPGARLNRWSRARKTIFSTGTPAARPAASSRSASLTKTWKSLSPWQMSTGQRTRARMLVASMPACSRIQLVMRA